MRMCLDCGKEPVAGRYYRCFDCLPDTHKGICPECGSRFVRTGAAGPMPKRCDPCRKRRKYESTKASQRRALLDPVKLERERVRRREQVKKWRADNPEKARQMARDTERRRWADPAKRPQLQAAAWKSRLRRQYNLTVERYEEILASQGGACAICQTPREEIALTIDHDHRCCPDKTSCGECVRGLLCVHCNHAVGRFRDDPEWMRRGAEYVERTRLRSG